MVNWTRFLGQVAGYGFLLFLIAMFGLLIMSFLLGAERSMDYTIASVVTAAIVGVAAHLFARRLKPVSPQEALLLGAGWMVVVAGILWIIAIANGTIGTVFGAGSTYLIFLGIPVSAWLAKKQ